MKKVKNNIPGNESYSLLTGRDCQRMVSSFQAKSRKLSSLKNNRKMKQIFLIATIITLFISGLNAQEIEETNGLYFKNNELYTGKYSTYFENGQLKMNMKIVEGKKEGKIRIYFENGQLHEIRSYKNNQMHGKWTMYNEQNIKVSVARYNNGKKHRKWKIWNDNGVLLYELQYKNGEKTGTWKSYDEQGNLLNERKY